LWPAKNKWQVDFHLCNTKIDSASNTTRVLQIVNRGGSRQKDKYNDVAFFMLCHRNVFCPQTRDLFSAGSVAGKERGGNYVLRSLKNIETEMRQAALKMDGALFVKYWGKDYPPEERIAQWLKRADSFAISWKPSDVLFKSG
jgi:hypothetical protein